MMRRLRAILGVAAMLPTALVLGLATPASAGASHALIEGSGSSWAANAVNQWVADVQASGIEVDYTANGDAQGRQDYANTISDFAVTSLGYQGRDPVTGVNDTSEGRPYAYLPIAAGGTAFPYQLRFHGEQVRNLRLSGLTLTKIFSNDITNWDDPAITKDNDGHALPSLPIIPVVQSEGSGATAQLTRYFDTEYPSTWRAFTHSSGLTEYFPRAGNQIAQNGSDGAMNYISSSAANGSIGYVEYSYALAQDYPVVKMLNTAGYYTLPTQYNVAVSLEKAQINMDKSSPNYLLQDLDDVYTDPDSRTYPLSSYVYMIIPTGRYPSPETKVTTAKRQSIADFVYYSICQGQREIGPIGYSPLPVNLVQAGFGQIQKLKQADSGVDLTERDVSTCNNPTFVEGHPDTNYLAQIAPLPPACDKQGSGPCADGVTPSNTDTTTSSGSKASTSTSVTTTTGASSSPGARPTAAATASAAAAAGPEVVPTDLSGSAGSRWMRDLAPVAALLLVAAVALPPVIARRLRKPTSDA